MIVSEIANDHKKTHHIPIAIETAWRATLFR